MLRTIVSKSFDADSTTPIDVIVETYDNGTIVEYRLSAPRLVLSVDKSQLIANGVDDATISVRFEACTLVANELVWATVVPIGTVTFDVNLRPTIVSIDAAGKAVLALSATIAGMYRIKAEFAGYGESSTVVEAIA